MGVYPPTRGLGRQEGFPTDKSYLLVSPLSTPTWLPTSHGPACFCRRGKRALGCRQRQPRKGPACGTPNSTSGVGKTSRSHSLFSVSKDAEKPRGPTVEPEPSVPEPRPEAQAGGLAGGGGRRESRAVLLGILDLPFQLGTDPCPRPARTEHPRQTPPRAPSPTCYDVPAFPSLQIRHAKSFLPGRP